MELETVPQPMPPARKGLSPWVKLGVVVAILSAAVAFLLFGGEAQEAFVYSKSVPDVMRSPKGFKGKALRVEGDLKKGSVLFREKPCAWKFTLEKEGFAMPVEFPQCIVPDTFRDGMGISVVVQGRIQDNGEFLATQVIPRCPSKYEMNQRAKKGEAMPHADPLVKPAPKTL